MTNFSKALLSGKRCPFTVILILIASLSTASFAAPGDITAEGTNGLPQLLRSIATKFRFSIDRGADGEIVSLGLPSMYANTQNLALIGTLSNLPDLHIFRGGEAPGRNIPQLTETGILCLAGITNLASLDLSCLENFSSNVLRGVSALSRVRKLTIYNVPFPSEEFRWLRNMTNLAELDVECCANFGDQELLVLTNLSSLKRLKLFGTGVSPDGTNVLAGMHSLTNVVFEVPQNITK